MYIYILNLTNFYQRKKNRCVGLKIKHLFKSIYLNQISLNIKMLHCSIEPHLSDTPHYKKIMISMFIE